MPDPNKRSRRRRSTGSGGDFGPYNHPTLTPRGYELMQASPLKDERYHLPLAGPSGPPSRSSPNIGVPVEGVPIQGRPIEYDIDGNPIIEIFPQEELAQPTPNPSGFRSEPQGRPDHRDAHPQPTGSPGQFFSSLSTASPLHNTLPSRKFPNPDVLTRSPLTRYFKSNPVGLSSSVANGRPDFGRTPTVADRQLRAIGRLVIHIDEASWDQPAFGSAWIVGPSLIATCAHNLFDSNHQQWSRAIEFYPGFDYYESGQPIQCNVTSCYVPSSYLDNPATNDDIAFCHVDRNIGDLIDAEIPIVPPENNQFFDDHKVTVMGYPAGAEFDFGKKLWSSRGEYLFGRSSGPGDEYSPVVATNFGGGCSGCPWLALDRKSGMWKAVGLSSGHARLYYQRGELNLMSLTSPMITQERLDRLSSDHVTHEFEQAT